MKVKVSDIMLDLATGDASVHDAYIQEAMGQVKVSAAIYDAAKLIASLDDSERSQIVQEAADAGLPSDREGAMDLVYESVERELIGLTHQFYTEMYKLDERATKPTTPYAAMNALAKSLGCDKKLDGTLEYAMEYAKTVSEGKKETKLKSGTRHLKGKSAVKQTKNLIQGACILANALGIAIADVERQQFLNMAESFKISAVLNKQMLMANAIFQILIDAGSLSSKCLVLPGAEVVRLEIKEGARITKAKVKDLNIPEEITFAGLIRNGRSELVTGHTLFVPGDHILVVCLKGALQKAKKLFGF